MLKKEIVKKNMINAVLSGDENLKAFNEYTKIIALINESDNICTKEVFDVLKKEIDNNQSPKFVDCAKQVLIDLSKAIKKNLTYEQIQ